MKKLLAWVVALLIAAMLAVPAFAQEDISAEAGQHPFTAEHCPAITADPETQELFYAIFPDLAEICG